MKIITKNKKAYFDYDIKETMEAGVVLTGDEVKSIRAGNVTLLDSFATIHQGEVTLLNCSIASYSHAYQKTDRSRRTRKLLLKKREINKLIGAIAQKGLTLIPLMLYFNQRGLVKIQLGLAKHKKAIEKKQALKERDIKREAAREVSEKIRFK